MLIFIVTVVIEVLGTRVPVNQLLHSMKHSPTLEAWSPGVAAGILALLVLVATAVMAKIEGRTVLSYAGLRRSSKQRARSESEAQRELHLAWGSRPYGANRGGCTDRADDVPKAVAAWRNREIG